MSPDEEKLGDSPLSVIMSRNYFVWIEIPVRNWLDLVLNMSDILVNREFICAAALRDPPVRIDGRGNTVFRPTEVRFSNSNGLVEVSIGDTLVSACVSGEITAPMPDHPNEGRLFFNVEVGQIANPTKYEYGKPSAEAVSICNYVERVLKGSKAFDNESLCILGGRSVWSIRCDIHVLNDAGSLPDACSLAALCSLINFRHEASSLTGDQAVMHSFNSREPVPISIHHLPVSSSFAMHEDEDEMVYFADPNAEEVEALGGIISLAVNQHGELCSVNKPGGVAVDLNTLKECLDISISRAKDAAKAISQIVEKNRMVKPTSTTQQWVSCIF